MYVLIGCDVSKQLSSLCSFSASLPAWGKTVYDKRDWAVGTHSNVLLCHPRSASGVFSTNPLKMELDNGEFITPGTSGMYIISGDAFTCL